MFTKKALKRSKNINILISLLPFILGYIAFNLFPIVYTLVLSFTDYDGISDELNFVNFDNYIQLFSDQIFWLSVYNTVILWLVSFIPQLVCALILGYILTYSKIIGKNFFKVVFYFPNLVTITSMAFLFSSLLDWQTGTVNNFLVDIGLIDANSKIRWMLTPFNLKFSTSFIIWFSYFGQTTIIVVAALTSLPKELLDAGKIDGAKGSAIFFRIVVPLMKPVILYLTVTSLVGGMQAFDLMNVLTNGNGGPEQSILTMIMYMCNQSFVLGNVGYGASVSWAVFMIIVFLGFFIYLTNRKL